MAELTLKDVLKAITRLEKGQSEIRAEMATKEHVAELRADVTELRADVTELRADVTELRADVAELRADVAAHRGETKKGFADLDKELTGHANVHKELEKDVEALKGRPLRTAARTPRRRPAR